MFPVMHFGQWLTLEATILAELTISLAL